MVNGNVLKTFAGDGSEVQILFYPKGRTSEYGCKLRKKNCRGGDKKESEE